MDYIEQLGAELLNTPQASPVDRERGPLQRAMNRPQVQVSQPSASTMSTIMPNGTIAMASPTPQVQQQFAMPQSRGMPTPPQVTTVQDRPDLNQEVRAQQSPLGQGQFTPEMLRKAEDASKIVEQVQRNPQIQQDPTFMDRVKDYFGSRENMVRLALGFNSMRLEPDANLAAGLREELSDIRKTQTARQQTNQTAAYFDQVDPEIANAIRAGLDPKDAIALFREKQKGVVVGKMVINPTTGDVIYDGSQEGSDLPATYRSLQLRAEAAGLAPGTEAYRQFMINGGQRAGMSLTVRPDGTVELSEGGALGGKALTEGQGKGVAFGSRMENAQSTINRFENQGTDIYNAIVSNVPFAGNLLTSEEFKQYDQAKQDFINAQLRWESGAAIGQDEFRRADLQYFPQPGDTPAVIEQKRRNRQAAVAAMQAVSGPQAEAYAKQIRVQLFGDRAANWPSVGTVKEGDGGKQYRFIGGDPNIETNWEEQ